MTTKKRLSRVLAFALVLALMTALAVPGLAAAPVGTTRATFPSSYISTSGSNRIALKVKATLTNEYLNVYSSSGIGDQKTISTWSWTGDTTQKFIIYRGSDNITSVRMYDNTMYGLTTSAGNCILRYLPYVSDVNNLTISNIHSEIYSGFMYAWALDLQSGGSLTATNTPTAVAGGYKVAWQNFTGSNRQIWHIDKI